MRDFSKAPCKPHTCCPQIWGVACGSSQDIPGIMGWDRGDSQWNYLMWKQGAVVPLSEAGALLPWELLALLFPIVGV